jgi:pyruvate dehydrogenase E2 component (dihydrolipoamide acetyltransferase)
VQAFVKARLAAPAAAAGGALALPPMPDVDFSKFGPVEERALHKIRRVSAANLHRSWLHVPRVTQFDEADITELEAFRQSLKDEAAKRGVKLTPLAFLMKATVAALREFPDLRSAWHSSGEKLIQRNYYHLGVAVDTDNGLVVPVIRDVDQKGVFELAEELGAASERARAGKMLPTEVRGAVFSITSLGGIGGTGFTPIVNAPEVGILSVSRSSTRPVWDGKAFAPRLVLPFGLTYDHRVVDGATAVRFTTYLARLLGDVRRLLL